MLFDSSISKTAKPGANRAKSCSLKCCLDIGYGALKFFELDLGLLQLVSVRLPHCLGHLRLVVWIRHLDLVRLHHLLGTLSLLLKLGQLLGEVHALGTHEDEALIIHDIAENTFGL